MFSLASKQGLSSLARRVMSNTTGRCLSTVGLKSYPQYTIYGPECFLSVGVILPTLKVLRNEVLVVDRNKNGRFLLEWIARGPDGKGDRDSSIRFALTAEEAGLLVDQLPDNDVELSRSGGPGLEEVPDKVFRAIPDGQEVVSFIVDFEKDGVGGKMQDSVNADGPGPLRVDVSAGEFVVIRELIQKTIPTLVGWSEMMRIAIDSRIEGADTGPVGGPSPPSSSDSYGLPF